MRFYCAIILFGICSLANAQDAVFNFHGFGTLSAVKTDDKDYVYRRFEQAKSVANEWSLTPESLLALQFDVNSSSGWFGALQLLATQREKRNITVSPEWAFVGYYFTPHLDIKVGRVLTPLFLQSKYRYVGYLTSTVRPSIMLYPLDPISTHDGLSLNFSQDNVLSGYLAGTFFLGVARYNVATSNDEGLFKSNLSTGFALDWMKDDLTLHVGYNYLSFHVADSLVSSTKSLDSLLNGCTTRACEAYSDRIENLLTNSRLEYWDVGARVDNEKWMFMSEVFIRSTDSIYQEAYGVNTVFAWHFGNWSPYFNTGLFRTTKNADEDERLNSQPAPVPQFNDYLKSSHSDRDVAALGLRWDFIHNFAIKAEAMRIHELSKFSQSSTFTPIIYPSAAVRDQWFNLYTVTLDFMF